MPHILYLSSYLTIILDYSIKGGRGWGWVEVLGSLQGHWFHYSACPTVMQTHVTKLNKDAFLKHSSASPICPNWGLFSPILIRRYAVRYTMLGFPSAHINTPGQPKGSSIRLFPQGQIIHWRALACYNSRSVPWGCSGHTLHCTPKLAASPASIATPPGSATPT